MSAAAVRSPVRRTDGDRSAEPGVPKDGTVPGEVPRRPDEPLREWIRRVADDLDTSVKEVLFLSPSNDPMNVGTDADHAKGEWFGEQWERAVGGRERRAIHTRGVHYAVVMREEEVPPPTDGPGWATYGNTEQCYAYLKDASIAARLLGYVPIDGILDERNETTIHTAYGRHRTRPGLPEEGLPAGVALPALPSADEDAVIAFDDLDEDAVVDHLASALADAIRPTIAIDEQRCSPYHLELWSEKTLPDEVTALFEHLGGDVVVEGAGELSYTIAHDLVRRVEAVGKPAVVLYLSDFDPKGTEMAPSMAGKLAYFRERGTLTQRVAIEQAAITPAQIEAHGLPRAPIARDADADGGARSYTTLVDEWERRHGYGAVELNVLETRLDLFERILRDAVEPLEDPDLAAKKRRAVERWERRLQNAVAEAVRETDGIEAALADLADWVDAFNGTYEDLQDDLAALRAHRDDADGGYRQWRAALDRVASSLSVPAVTLPEGEPAEGLPEDLVYDSARPYLRNVRRTREHR